MNRIELSEKKTRVPVYDGVSPQAKAVETRPSMPPAAPPPAPKK